MVHNLRNIQKRINMDLLTRSTFAIYVHAIIIPASLFPFGYFTTMPRLSWYFTGLMLFICLLRIIHRYFIPSLHSSYPKAWLCVFSTLAIAQATTLGSFFAVVLYDARLQDILQVAVLLVMGIASGAVSALSPRYKLALLYLFFLLFPGILVSFIYGENTTYAFMMVLYLFYLSSLAIFSHKQYMRTFSIESLLEKQKAELEEINKIDSLTNIYNRGYFNMAQEMQWDMGARNAIEQTLFMIDVDHFKSINDRYGHLAGDECLKAVAQVLLDGIKRKTDVVARFGGEEFSLLVENIEKDEALKLAEELREAVEKTWIVYEKVKFKVTISIGVAQLFPKNGMPSSVLINNADIAMYQAKASGRNKVCYYQQ